LSDSLTFLINNTRLRGHKLEIFDYYPKSTIVHRQYRILKLALFSLTIAVLNCLVIPYPTDGYILLPLAEIGFVFSTSFSPNEARCP